MAVYFIQAGDGGEIKIGTAQNPWARLKELQTGNGKQLRLLAVVPGGPREEGELHDRFRAHGIRGEWFAPHAEIITFVEGVTAAQREKPPSPPPAPTPPSFELENHHLVMIRGFIEGILCLKRAWVLLDHRRDIQTGSICLSECLGPSELLEAVSLLEELSQSWPEYAQGSYADGWTRAGSISTETAVEELRELIEAHHAIVAEGRLSADIHGGSQCPAEIDREINGNPYDDGPGHEEVH